MLPLRVMTFNVRLGGALDGENRWYRRRELVFETMSGAAAHVAGLQEVSSFQLDELMGALPAFGVLADRRYGSQRRGAYAPILFDASRLEPAQSGDFWLAPDPDGARRRGWDAAVPRICTWAVFTDRLDAGRRFALLNTHFDHAGSRARAESARLVVEKLGRLVHIPRIITADLNASPVSEPYAILAAAGFRDAFGVLHPDEEASTYHGFRGRGIPRLGRIDHVLCDGRWRVLSAALLRDGRDGRFPSDHFAVTAELVLKA